LKDEIVVLTHNDLDAVGSVMAIQEAFPQTRLKIFETNYLNIKDVIDDIERYVHRTGVDTLFCTDVAFGTNKEDLLHLSEMCPNFLWIDHHHYNSSTFFDDLNFPYHHDNEKCAALLTFQHMSKLMKNEERKTKLEKLITLIDVYDLWKVKSPHFKTSQDLNNFSKEYSVQSFAQTLYNNGYKLPSNYTQWVQNYNDKCKKYIEKVRKNKLVYNANNISIIFADEYINEIVQEEMDKGTWIVMNANSYGLIRFRFNSLIPDFTDETKLKLKLKILENNDIGHLHAFTLKTEKGFDSIMNKLQHYAELIQKELYA
jgi:hypothetical protein